MNTLILQIKNSPDKLKQAINRPSFSKILNAKTYRILRLSFLSYIVLMAVIYIFSLFAVFNFGAKITKSSNGENVLLEEVSSLKLQLANLETNFASTHQNFISGMQKVSKADFVEENGTAVSFLSNQ